MLETLPITTEEKVLLHLNRYKKFFDSYVVPKGMAQDGISDTLSVSRNYISEVLSHLIVEGLVGERTAHVVGERKRKKVYSLTEKGIKHASELLNLIRDRTTTATDTDGSKREIKLSELIERHMPQQIVDVVRTMTVDKLISVSKPPRGPELYPETKLSLKLKICLLGDMGVGKTSLIRKYVYDVFDDSYISTIGTKVTFKELVVTRLTPAIPVKVKLLVWDMMGAHDYNRVLKSAIVGAKGAFLVCDITNKETLKNIEYWLENFTEVVGDVPMILLVNKSDLVEKSEITLDDVKYEAARFGIPYYYTSAKTGKSVNEVFLALTNAMLPDDELRLILAEMAEREGVSKKSIILITDEIIDDFCASHGGHENAMSIVRAQIEAIGMDMTRPTTEDLRRLVIALQNAVKNMVSPEELKKTTEKYLKWINELESST